jgi:adenosine deaminase
VKVEDLPKAELHVHLEGTLEPDMLLALARRNQVPVPWSSVAELQAAYQFTGLEHFLPLLFKGCGVLRTRQDFYDLTLAYLGRAASQNVVRAEWGIDGALIVTAQRHRTQAAALELFELVQPWATSIIGFGLGAAERGNPPAKFAGYYARARQRGFRTTIHAGEDGPPATSGRRWTCATRTGSITGWPQPAIPTWWPGCATRVSR